MLFGSAPTDTATTTPGAAVANTVSANVNVDPFSLGDVTLYVGGGQSLYTIDPFTGAMETTVNQGGSLFPNSNASYGYNDFAMRVDGHLVSYQSNAGAGAFVEFNTGDARTANVDQTTGINIGEADPDPNDNSPVTINGVTVYTKARNVKGASWDMEAMMHDPLTPTPANATKGTQYVYMVGNMFTGPGYLNPADDPKFPTTNLLFVFNADGTPVRGFNEYGNATTAGPRTYSDVVPFGDLNTDSQGNPVAKITGMSTIGTTIYVATTDGKIYTLNGASLTNGDQTKWNWAFESIDDAKYTDATGKQTTLARRSCAGDRADADVRRHHRLSDHRRKLRREASARWFLRSRSRTPAT